MANLSFFDIADISAFDADNIDQRHISLSPQHSVVYLTNPPFRDFIRSYLKDPSTQLSLSLFLKKVDDRMLQHIGSIYALDLTGCDGVTNDSLRLLTSVKKLNLSGLAISDLSPFFGVPFEEIVLKQCFEVLDVAPLFNVTALICEGNNFANVNHLGNLSHLNLTNCLAIRDVAGLCDVPELILDCCWEGLDASDCKGLRSFQHPMSRRDRYLNKRARKHSYSSSSSFSSSSRSHF